MWVASLLLLAPACSDDEVVDRTPASTATSSSERIASRIPYRACAPADALTDLPPLTLDLRSAGASLPAFDAGLFAYARGLAHWQRQNRFCSACGAALAFEAGGHRARCTNPQCGIAHFPRTDPAVIMIVSDGARCLLGRGPKWPERRYSTLAGFVEPGETLEDAVRREVFEEAGVRVGECDYHSSQPWPFPASIMLGFTAHAEDAKITLGSILPSAIRMPQLGCGGCVPRPR